MRFSILIIFTLINVTLYAQQTEFSKKSKASFFQELNLKSKTDEMKVSVFLSEEWTKYDITLQNMDEVKGLIAKYDIRQNQFEIREGDKTGILKGSRVKNFSNVEQNKEVYYNLNSLENWNDQKHRNGFVKTVYDGESQEVYKYYFVKITETGGNSVLGIPSTKKFSLGVEMLVQNNVGVFAFESNKKKNLKFFEGSENQISSYIKKNKLSYKKEEDIEKIFSFYDDLVANHN